MADREPSPAELDAQRRPQRGISNSRRVVESAAQQLASLPDEKPRRQALRLAAQLPLPSEDDAARDVKGHSEIATGPQSLSVHSSVPRDESSATAWASARSTSEVYRDAKSTVDSASDSDDDEQTSALTPLRPDQQEAARAAGLTAGAPVAGGGLPFVPTADQCNHEEWSPSSAAAAPVNVDPPRQLQRISRGSARPLATAPVAEQSGRTNENAICLDDSSDDDWQAAGSGICASETRKPLQRLHKAGTRAQRSEADVSDRPARSDAADALGNAMASLTVHRADPALQRLLLSRKLGVLALLGHPVLVLW